MTTDALYESVPLMVRRVVNRIGKPLGVNPFPRAFTYNLEGAARATDFDHIYHDNVWASEQSRSGVGSELASTRHYRAGLVDLIKKQGFTSIFDAPCGDLHWMPDVIARTGITYKGGDISSAVVDAVRQRYGHYQISQFDISTDPFPMADVWHCRDCQFHLPFADIRAALNNFVWSDIPYALLTTHRSRWLHRNLDIQAVGFRYLDLECAPISLPAAITYIADYKRGLDFPRFVGLWSRDAIAHALKANGWLE